MKKDDRRLTDLDRRKAGLRADHDPSEPAQKSADKPPGVPPLDANRKRVNVRFYQIAMLFILFDIEAAFLYPWAVIYRD